jgi:hypothetical protein
MIEEWRDVPGYEGLYQVSDKGRVRSLDRVVPDSRWGLNRKPGKVLQPNPHSVMGYLRVVLYRQGVRRNFDVHQLVALAFIGLRPEGMEVCHNSGDVNDNRVENVRYDTRSGNMRDRARHGTYGLPVVRLSDGKAFSSISEALRASSSKHVAIRKHCDQQVRNPKWRWR